MYFPPAHAPPDYFRGTWSGCTSIFLSLPKYKLRYLMLKMGLDLSFFLGHDFGGFFMVTPWHPLAPFGWPSGLMSQMQWAAVTTHFLLIRAPPQKLSYPVLDKFGQGRICYSEERSNSRALCSNPVVRMKKSAGEIRGCHHESWPLASGSLWSDDPIPMTLG